MDKNDQQAIRYLFEKAWRAACSWLVAISATANPDAQRLEGQSSPALYSPEVGLCGSRYSQGHRRFREVRRQRMLS